MAAFIVGIALGLCTVSASALTPVETIFELDGNAIDETAIGSPDDSSPPDDWGQGNAIGSSGYVSGPSVSPANPGGGADVSAFILDPNGDTGVDNIFAGGGSKDDLPIEKWGWTSGSPPDKTDLLAVGAAAYVDGTELVITGFGSLYAANGDSSIGGWFFKKNIGPCSNGLFGVVDNSLPGRPCLPEAEQPADLHSFGDLLVISENTNGGTITNMSVYNWVGDETAKCASELGGTLVSPKNSLCLIGEFAGATCDGIPATNPFVCGIMNQVDTESPDDYGYMSKSPPLSGGPAHPAGTDGIDIDDFPPLTFFEGGVNITELFGNAECFSSFLRNTRTSASVRSQLKDFASGAFSLCGLNVVKTCPSNRATETGGFCSIANTACETNMDCPETESCKVTNPLFLFGDTVRTQFSVTIGKDGPANLVDVMLTEETLDGCKVVVILGEELETPIPLPKGTSTKVLDSLTADTTLVMECDSTGSITTQKVTVEAKTVSGSTVGPESFTMLDNNCKPETEPGLNLQKACNGNVKLIKDSGLLKFSVPVKITVTNTGDEDLINITVSDDQIGTLTTVLSLDKGALPKVFEETYLTDTPENGSTTEWLGCDVAFKDTASIDAAEGVFSGALGGDDLPLDVPVTCVFCPNTCTRSP